MIIIYHAHATLWKPMGIQRIPLAPENHLFEMEGQTTHISTYISQYIELCCAQLNIDQAYNAVSFQGMAVGGW